VDIRELTDTCVHCGLCLPACPTYQLHGAEADSPRGRIHLLRQVLDGAATPGQIGEHIDACLGCLACVPACPSGVRYEQIIEHARGAVDAARAPADRAVRDALLALFPYPRRLAALRAPQRLGLTPPAARPALAGHAAQAAAGLALSASVALAGRVARVGAATQAGRGVLAGRAVQAVAGLAPPIRRRVPLPDRVRARPAGRAGARRAVVGLLTGCVQHVFFSHVAAATARVLALEGCDVLVPHGQGCCGALPLHVGRRAQAERLARRTVAAFTRAGVDVLVTDAAGCGSTMKEYARLLADDRRWSGAAARLAERVRDVTQVLAELGPVAPRHPLPLTVAYHDACHLAYGQGVTRQARDLLTAVPSLRLVEVPDRGTCCGSAGLYNLLRPEPAGQLGERKAKAILSTGADLVVAGDPGCLLQIDAALRRVGGPIPVRHTVELLDASLCAPA
jgi:glycolate oxidase iron-sulfur subunit